MEDSPTGSCSKADARQAGRELARHAAARPRTPISFVHQSPWHVPIRWFVLFDDAERRLHEDEHGRLRLRYRTTARRAMRRAEDAVPALRRSDLGPISELILDLHQWMAAFDHQSILELDYGGLSDLMTWDELDDDRSVRELHEALEALERYELRAGRRHLPGRAGPLGRDPQPRDPELAARPPYEWPGAESNCRHRGFQPRALPTELPGPGR